MQPQPAAPSAQSQLPPPMQPTLPAPLQPQQAAAPKAGPAPAAAPAGPPQGLASPKPPPRSRSSHALPPDAAKSETAPAAQVGANFLFMKLLEFQKMNKEHKHLLNTLRFFCLHVIKSCTRDSCSNSAHLTKCFMRKYEVLEVDLFLLLRA